MTRQWICTNCRDNNILIGCACGCGQIIFANTKKHKRIKFKKGHYTAKGPLSPSWKGGRKISRFYILIWQPSHPHADRHGYVQEHRLVMEKHIGRYLTRKERVHHINDIKDDNRIENLQLMATQAEHMAFHKEHDIRLARIGQINTGRWPQKRKADSD